ncbi:MAG: DUF1997 domain-containing protein [Cylindrospermopsis raciborskii 1523720]|uniref:DUF1997 domain-containing protein n=2 Tax=Cylindrospermopsis raciborskii TaxID=77022 RepID=UPI001F0D5D1F|nr:DUF1997 domain-containing protein [Cylindrospermopsis raciborskii]MEB3146043.1 DUF1997 domain-containing protein [Cylindrospermopsis raciborskii]
MIDTQYTKTFDYRENGIMVANNWEFQSLELGVDELDSSLSSPISHLISEDALTENYEAFPSKFYSHHREFMKMQASSDQVMEYFNCHSAWFIRCAQPMVVHPLGENGYTLVIGRFGAFGYEVEPKIGLELLVPGKNQCQIRSIPIPNYQAPGYDINYNAYMQLIEDTPGITRVEWQLDLTVYLQFPKFIRRLPSSLVQSTGDRLLNQVVRQVSRRLTRKVQEDFHGKSES